MSTPALNPLPSARRMTTRVWGLAPAAVMASANPNHSSTVSAFTGGQFMTTSVMPCAFWCVSIPTRRGAYP